jgi:hypothetical protein
MNLLRGSIQNLETMLFPKFEIISDFVGCNIVFVENIYLTATMSIVLKKTITTLKSLFFCQFAGWVYVSS